TVQNTTKLQETLRERVSQLQKGDELRKYLRNSKLSKEMKSGPATDFKKAMAEGNFAEARQQLRNLSQKLRGQHFTPQDRAKLAQQLEDLQKQLDEIAKLKERQDALDKADLDPEARAQEQAKLDEDRKNLQDLQKMAENAKDAAKALQDGKDD